MNFDPNSPDHFLPSSFYLCDPNQTNDTIAFHNIQLNTITGTGIQLGKGSSIYVSTGRIVGNYPTGAGNSVALYAPGGDGGVFVNDMDFIQHGIGIKITQDNGSSNKTMP